MKTLGVLEGRLLQHGRDALLLAEGADAADVVAGDALGVRRLHHLGGLAAESGGELLQVHLLIRGQDHAGRLVVHQHHQGLEHARRIRPHGLGRLQADALRVGVVVVGMDREGHAGLLQRLRRAGCSWTSAD